MRYAGFKVRSKAYTIDGFAIIAITYLVYYLTGGAAQAQDIDQLQDLSQLLQQAEQDDPLGTLGWLDRLLSDGPSFWLATAVSAAYNIGFAKTRWHGTPGKHRVGVKIVMADGRPVTWQAAIIRHAATGLSTLILFFGFFMVGWTKQKTALHDLIADTRVVYRES
ncbi:MAG: RDD family protein [Alphaproteobacteria bacterium]